MANCNFLIFLFPQPFPAWLQGCAGNLYLGFSRPARTDRQGVFPQCRGTSHSRHGADADGSSLGDPSARVGLLTCAGRLTFPIFAFMAVEGYFHTHSFRKYALRLALFAVLSEVPFDLMYSGTWFYPVHQNVIWTLLLGLLGIHLMETARKKQKTWLYLLTALLVVLIGTVLGTLSMVDYYGTGVLTIFIFYFFRGRKWWCLTGQLLALYWVNVQLLGGLLYPVRIFGMEFEICQQGLALLAFLPIWL